MVPSCELRAQQIDVVRALALGFVHQLVGALNEVGGQAAGDEPPVGDAPEPQADDADVHAHRLHRQASILERPVVALDRLAKALADGVRLVTLGQVGDQEAELVAAEPRVQILATAGRRAPAPADRPTAPARAAAPPRAR